MLAGCSVSVGVVYIGVAHGNDKNTGSARNMK